MGMNNKRLREMPDDYWKEKLSEQLYHVARQKGTEAPFSGEYVTHHEDGTYHCMACGQMLFDSGTKFDSGTGWPSFTAPANLKNVELTDDNTLGMQRTEVTCANCGAHLGHVFSDGPVDRGGQRYCINSISLDFKPSEKGSNI